MKCLKCGGSKFVQGAPIVAFGRTFPTVGACPDCGGDGFLQDPKFSAPKVERPPRSNNPKGRDLSAEAADWIRTHPLTAALFLKFARELASRGRRFGIGMITERIRYEGLFEGWKPEDYKVNNNHRAYIARWIIAQDPAIEKYIEFRETKWGPRAGGVPK